MRKLEFPSGTRPKTRATVSALAWATNRRGRVAWKSANVTTQVSEYLSECGFAAAPTDIAYAMRWLEDKQLGYRKVMETGKRTLEFGFLPDVDLTGHTADGLTKISKPIGAVAPPNYATPAPGLQPVAKVADPTTNGATATIVEPDIDIPIPGALDAPIYREDELMGWLRKYAEHAPESYAKWADKSITMLTTVLEGA